jgi:XTP/dITP diphosphohydrolase
VLMDIVLATTNGHKIREIRALLKPFKQFELYSLLDFPNYIQPEETGKTFEENAILKALDCAQKLQKWAIADDSGLVVPALGGSPGVFSARYAGKGATDKENRYKLLQAMKYLEGLERSAYFECCIALARISHTFSDSSHTLHDDLASQVGEAVLHEASPAKVYTTVSAICEGIIVTEERGRHGFGYDSLFLKHDYNQTFAELSEERKNLVSHRGKALEKLKRILERISHTFTQE